MARRDVDLVIRARDEAAKVVDTITKSLNEFAASQRELDSRSEKTESSLGSLGAAIKRLESDLKGLDVGAKLSQELDDAAKSLARLDVEFKKTQQEAANVERQLQRTAAQTERYAQKLAGAAAAQEKQTAALKRAKADQSALSNAYKQSAAAQAKLQSRQAKLPELIDRQAAAATRAAARFDDLSAQIAGTDKPSRTLQKQFESSERATQKASSRLTELRQEYGAISTQLRAAGSAMAIFGTQADRAAGNVKKQERVLGKIGQNLNVLKVQTNAAGREQNKLAGSFSKVTAKLAKQQQEIDRAQGNFVQLASASKSAEAALAKLSQQSIGVLSKELKDQRRSALEAKRAFVELTKETGKLGAEVSRVGVPTAKLSRDFAKSQAAARRAKQDYLNQRIALEQLGRVFRSTGADIESIRASQQRFAQIQTDLAAKLAQSAAAADRQQQEIRQTAAASDRAAASSDRLRQRTEANTRATRKGAAATGRLATAYQQFYGDTRRSLSLLQRIRGEVLSLVAAYGGLYGAIQVLKGTVDATQKLEAAQSRLGVAFDGDGDRVSAELDFVRRTSDRLGVSLGVLATEYSKFNIAAKNTSLEGANARKIFVSVAEAARVNRSSTEELSGVFVALTQIVSKGAVQMEELRQQLGDRLPGAIKIMADGLGVTTGELIKLMEAGQITEAALIPFAEELDRRFGPGLGEALASTSVALGRLGNAAFQALVRFGKAGFIESFTAFANTLTEVLSSADFEAFSARASTALGGLVDLLAFGAKNFQFLVAAVTGFIALKLTPVFIAVGGAMRDFTIATGSAAAGLRGVGVAGATATTRLGAVAGALRGVTVAIRGLLAATGVGLLVTAIAVGISAWATSADEATEALNSHRKLVDQVKNGYDAVGGAVELWREKLSDLTVTEARDNLRRVRDALKETVEQFEAANRLDGASFATTFFGRNILSGASKEYNDAVQGVLDKVEEGSLAVADFREEIDKVNEQFNDGSETHARYAASLDKAAKAVEEAAAAQAEAEKIVKALTGSTDEAQAALDDLAGVAREAADALDPRKTAAYSKSLEVLQKIIVETTKEAGLLADTMDIENAFSKAIENAQTLEERIVAAITQAEALDAVNQKFVDANFGNFTSGEDAAAALIRQLEDFQPTAKFDVTKFRAGFGSDTITLSDGSIHDITEGMRVSMADANRDLARRIGKEFVPIVKNAIGADTFATFNPQQQAALISIAYNYGKIPEKIVEAIKTGTNEQIAAAIIAQGSEPGINNPGRRRTEAALFLSTAGQDTQIAEQLRLDEERSKAAEEKAKLEADFRAGLQEEIAATQFALEIEKEGLIQREVAKALREAELEAQKAGVELTQEERQQIEEVTRAKFAQQAADEAADSKREKAVAAEAEVNRLLGIQTALRDQLSLAMEQGNLEKTTALKDEINEVNDEMLKAIDNAIRMWEAIGGPESEAAIAKLTTAGARAKVLNLEGDKSYFSWVRVKDLFIDGLSGAFDSFAKGIAEGRSAISSARDAFLQFASDFLRQIAQMIIKQAIFNALKGAFGGTSFGSLIGLGHTGGLVGSSRVGSGNSTRSVNPAIFAGATRYHSGGIIGLKPGEVPIIAQQNEEMLTRDDPRHMLNGGGAKQSGRAPGSATKVVNAFDGTSFLEQALRGAPGEKVLLNFVSANSSAVRSALGI